MARRSTKDTEENVMAEEAQVQEQEAPKTETKKTDEIPSYVESAMKIYSFMEELIVNSKGFVFTPGTPQSMHNDGILYKNKYFSNN